MQSSDPILGISRMANSARRGLALTLVAFVVAACGAIGGSANATLCPAAELVPVSVDTKAAAPVTYAVLIDRAYTGDAKRRSEERRVGKECRTRWEAEQQKR